MVKDKTFVFGFYEGTFQNGGYAEFTTVPTPAALAGNFSGIPGVTIYSSGLTHAPYPRNIVPPNQLNPTALAIAKYLPASNLPGLFDNYVATPPYVNHANKADGRVDQRKR